LNFIENEANAKEPFLLYWTPDATHTPLYASEKFRGRSSRGLCVSDFKVLYYHNLWCQTASLLSNEDGADV